MLKIINNQSFSDYSYLNFDDVICTNKDIILLNKIDNTIYKIDNNSNFTLYKLQIKIYKMCYDECENCYWILTDSNYNNIYKLDENFRKISYIQLNYPINKPIKIYDISYCKVDNLFIITTKKYIFKFDKNGNCKEKIYENNSLKTYLSAYSFCNCTYILYYQDKKSYISLLKDGKEVNFYKIPYTFIPCSIAYIKKCKNSKNEIITLTARNDDSSKMQLISLSHDCKDNSSIHCLSKSLDEQNMINSIISMEKTLSYLLDLESKKLEKGIQVADSVNEMLKLNENLIEIIVNITQLEYLLITRLKVLKNSK